MHACRFTLNGAHHGVIELLGHRVPRLVILHVAVVGVVGAVTNPPAVVGHQNGAVHDVAHQVVQCLVAAEALVPAARTHGGGFYYTVSSQDIPTVQYYRHQICQQGAPSCNLAYRSHMQDGIG